jgi:hypothetical protein
MAPLSLGTILQSGTACNSLSQSQHADARPEPCTSISVS